MPLRTVGVEEEFLLVDPETGGPSAIAAAMLETENGRTDAGSADDEPAFEAEMKLQQIETATAPCTTLPELTAELRRARKDASKAAQAHGAELAALGTSPLEVHAELFPSSRYRKMAELFGATARDQLSCGCHVHVGIESEDEAIGVLDRIRPWLSVLLALSANSPFWQAEYTSYASYRTQVWARWPTAGPTELFGTPAAYHQAITDLTSTRTILDEGMVYYDARLSRHYPTVEVRVPDVCLRAEDAALIGVLTRALVETAARDWAAGVPAPELRTDLLKLATWRASRSGLDGELIDPQTQRPQSARVVVEHLFDHLRESLEESGDTAEAERMLAELQKRGTGANRQRAAFGKRGELIDVVTDAVQRTVS